MKRRKLFALLIVSTPAVAAIACAAPTPESTPVPATTPVSGSSAWPAESWRTSTPEEQGMDSEQLAAMLGTIRERRYKIDSVLVVRHGYLVLDAYVHPFGPNRRHPAYSCAKSVLSVLIGIAIDQGAIQGVEQPVLDFFPERRVAHRDAAKEAMTLRDLLTMATGLECRDSYLHNWRGMRAMWMTRDWVRYVLDLPMAEKPGTRFEYCNGASLLLSAILQKTTGMTALAFAEKHLFGPLGISDVEWSESPQGITMGWSKLHMLPHDMAKIGYLYLHRGRWNQDRVVSAAWVEASTRKYVSATLQDGYGYHWWIDPSGIYMALGAEGQFIFVVPDKQMVVVFTAALENRDFHLPKTLLDSAIIPAARSTEPLPENPDGRVRLESRLRELERK
ncbi:MAG: serine hydrolase [bacterium]|nr:serine hydrolase [bacterium]